jgi:hypothetical protein
LTNWAIADVGQDAFYVEQMSTTTENVPSGLTFAGRQIAFSMMEILK